MVIGPGKDGITAHVILKDDETIPLNLNDASVVVYRRGFSTNMELMLVKPLGVVLPAESDLLAKPPKPFCNYPGDGNPLHEHDDQSWWFYEETWSFESGPFKTYDEAYNALAEYCIGLEKTKEVLAEMQAEKEEGEKPSEDTEPGYRFEGDPSAPVGDPGNLLSDS